MRSDQSKASVGMEKKNQVFYCFFCLVFDFYSMFYVLFCLVVMFFSGFEVMFWRCLEDGYVYICINVQEILLQN